MLDLKNKTAKEVIKVFGFQLDVVRMTIVKSLTAYFQQTGNLSKEDAVIITGQVSNYLCGDDLNRISPNVTEEEVRQKIIEVRPRINNLALMTLSVLCSKENRGLIIFILRRRLFVENWLAEQGNKMEMKIGEQVIALLILYGSEFPKEVTDEHYEQVLLEAQQQANINE